MMLVLISAASFLCGRREFFPSSSKCPDLDIFDEEKNLFSNRHLKYLDSKLLPELAGHNLCEGNPRLRGNKVGKRWEQ
jgi:hypothetical protein